MSNRLSNAPLRKGAKQKYLTEKIAVIPDKLFIVRTRASGRKWSVKFYVPAAKQNKQFALNTTDIEVAKERALETYFSLKKRIDAGEKLSAITAQELVDRYLSEEAKRVVVGGQKRGGIVPERFKTIQTALKRHFLPFVKPNTKLGKIQETKFLEYVDYRRTKQHDVAISTLDNEMGMISKMLVYAKEKGLLHRDYKAQFAKLPRNTQPYAGGSTGRRSELGS